VTTKAKNLNALGRTTAAITFTRFNNKTVESRNAGQARTKRIATNHSCVAVLKRPLVLAFTVVLASLAFSAAPALASRGHQYTTSFGARCLAEPGCTGEELFKPNGVAINEATGDVYVVDEGEGAVGGRVVRFNKAGVFQGEFNGSGLDGEGVAAGFKEPKEPGEVETGKFDKPETIAVDNSCVLLKLSEPKCKEEDPSNGDVYVVDAGKEHRVIDKYTAEGEYVGQISEAAGSSFNVEPLDGVAVDSSGSVWIYQEGLAISEFTNGVPNKFVKSVRVALSALGDPGFAVDSEGDFYLSYEEKPGGPRIAKVRPSGEPVVREVDTEPSSSVAVDQTNDNALIDNLTSVAVFESSGTELKERERLGKEGGVKHLKEGAGIGVNASASTGSIIYVADAGTGEVVVFGPDQPAPPKVESNSESFSSVTSRGASLEAKINPQSEAGEAATAYHFEYGPCPTLDPSSCVGAAYTEVPGSAGQLSPDYESHQVSAVLEGLSPHTTYHFRAVARNSHNQENEYEPGAELTFTTEAAGGELVLPDNRGWELVSPPNKEGADIEPLAETGVIQAAASGNGITYLANAPTEASPQGYAIKAQVLSSRSSAAWSSRDISIPHSSAPGITNGQEYDFFNPELTLSAVQPFGEFNPGLSAEASESTAYLHDLSGSCGSDCYHPLVTGKPGFANVPAGTVFGEAEECQPKVTGTGAPRPICGPQFVGASEDLSHVVLRSSEALTGGAHGLFEWNEGSLSPVSVLPDGEATADAGLGLESKSARGAISTDGSQIVWEAVSGLYLRDMTLDETVQLDKAEAKCEGEAKCTSGGARFQIANTDGSRIFFTDENRLTSDSGATPEKRADLYECQIVFDPKLSCELSDLTPERGGEAASVQGGVLGASSDGSYLYFVAKGVQSGANGEGKGPTSGKPNLYVRHEASTSFIATLASGDEHDWEETLRGQPTRVSPNGQYLELMSQGSPTGYDNRDLTTGQPTAEVYLYDAATSKLTCASCMPTAVRPVGAEYHKLEPGTGGLVGGPRGIWPASALVAANVPGWTAIENKGESRYQPRYLNDEGRLFFNSADALVPQDSNGTEDVYEYEPAGIGGCSEAGETFSARAGGCVSLISSGSSNKESAFLDASESGNDVFFLTYSRLSPIDTDNSIDVYDAHVCTGASPCIAYPTVQSPPCTTEASCKASPSPQPSIFGAPPSATFQGPGNLAPAAVVKAKAKPLTRARKLSKALAACHKDRKKAKRANCEKAARKKYGPIKRAKKKTRKKGK
jgi:hypothetical protein